MAKRLSQSSVLPDYFHDFHRRKMPHTILPIVVLEDERAWKNQRGKKSFASSFFSLVSPL
jgi:hypothetical protein